VPGPSAGPPKPRWRAGYPEILTIPLDDELVVFNPISWETHLLNAAGAQVFEALLERAMSLPELRLELEDMRAGVSEPVRDEQIETLLAELEDLGLVTCLRSEAGNANR